MNVHYFPNAPCNMSDHLPLLQVYALKAPLTKAFFQNYMWSHNWQDPYNVNMVVAIFLLMYMTSILLPFAVTIQEYLTFCSERGTSLRGAPSHFTMRRKFHMSCFVTTVLPKRYVLICASFPLLNRFICFLNIMRVRITENRYNPLSNFRSVQVTNEWQFLHKK